MPWIQIKTFIYTSYTYINPLLTYWRWFQTALLYNILPMSRIKNNRGKWREKINLNLKTFYKGLKGLHKTFCGTTKKWK